MRDTIIAILVFGSLPFVFKKPWWGMVLWVWISVMNPHSQGWGWARTFPFAQIIAGVTVLSMLGYKGDKKLPMTAPVIFLLTFISWMCFTSLFAIHPDLIGDQFGKVLKIMAMNLVVIMLIKERKHIDACLATIVVSVGYYGVKGGLFTIRSGASERVWGPAGTFIEGNNEVALAFVMIIPLMMYLRTLYPNKWFKRGMIVAMLLCAMAALGSYSRGALLAIAAMAFFLWLRSNNKLTVGLLMVIAIPIMLAVMPSKWFDRMDTVQTYEQDASAMGRINAWKMCLNLAMDRPFGGSFVIYDVQTFARYAPIPTDIHAAHSLYFQVLGEHGFFGLFLYLGIGISTFRAGSWIVKHTKGIKELEWAALAAKMMQVSLLGFAVGGAFLSLVYFDVPYYIVAAMVGLRMLVEKELKQRALAPAPDAPAPVQVAGQT